MTLKPKTLWSLALLGLVIFLYVQVFPSAASDSVQQETASKPISKEVAQKAATEFAINVMDMKAEAVKPALTTYVSRSEVYGYLVKEDLLKPYTKKYNKQFPIEMYRVQFKSPDAGIKLLNVDVNINSGKVVGYEAISSLSTTDKNTMLETDSTSTEKLKMLEGNLTIAEKEKLAAPYIKIFGFEPGQLKLESEQDDVGLVYNIDGYQVGEAQAKIHIGFEYGQVSSVESIFSTPTSYLDYIHSQNKLANLLTYGGYALFTFILGILAIVFSAKTRQYTSFKRGVFLTLFYLLINVVSIINSLPVIEAMDVDRNLMMVALAFQGVLTLMMTASVYFSLVGGDGLWRQQRLNPWMRAGEEGYGKHVLKSSLEGYAWAFILLGAQSVIYIILGLTLHTWTTTEDSQSPYNMLYPWAFPLMAWLAGIGEEAVYRLFGIPMLKKIVKSTFLASLITTLIWAFGHTLYPVYPVISRPIELIFLGLIFSYIFLRSDYIGAMFAHVVFDSILMGLSLMMMGGTFNVITAIVTFALPAIVGFVIYKFNPPGKERKKEEPLITTPHPEGLQ